MSEYIPERKDGKQFYHPSEIGPTLDPEVLSIIEGESTERSSRILGATVIGLAASVSIMAALDAFTGHGYNPIDYAMRLTFLTNY